MKALGVDILTGVGTILVRHMCRHLDPVKLESLSCFCFLFDLNVLYIYTLEMNISKYFLYPWYFRVHKRSSMEKLGYPTQ